MLLTGVNKVAELVLANLLRTLAEDKEHGIDNVGLARAVWTNNRRKLLELFCSVILRRKHHKSLHDGKFRLPARHSRT